MKLRYASRAHADIAEIYQYIAKRNSRAATAVVRRIRTTSELLARFPDLDRETDIPGIRVLPISRYPYLVYHRLRGDEVVIVHIRHARRDQPGDEQL